MPRISVQVPQDRRRIVACALAFLGLLACNAAADQKMQFGAFEAHYVVFPSTFLSADIADSYGIARARDLSILNLSILDAAGEGTPVVLDGRVKNLLGQLSPLKFREIREGHAVYYLAEVRHTNREVLRFTIAITPPRGRKFDLEFQQELFWDE